MVEEDTHFKRLRFTERHERGAERTDSFESGQFNWRNPTRATKTVAESNSYDMSVWIYAYICTYVFVLFKANTNSFSPQFPSSAKQKFSTRQQTTNFPRNSWLGKKDLLEHPNAPAFYSRRPKRKGTDLRHPYKWFKTLKKTMKSRFLFDFTWTWFRFSWFGISITCQIPSISKWDVEIRIWF